MHTYAAFGTRLNSTIELPELVGAVGAAPHAWTLRVAENSSSLGGDLLGTEVVYGSILVRLLAQDGVLCLAFDDTGTFEVRPDERTITWYPGARRDGDAVRADILGRVLAVAVHAEGGLALHASAVSIGGRAIAFLGPKHAGKSTMAMSLVRQGARLLTDDMLGLRFDDRGVVQATPGVQRVRLWEDSSRVLHTSAASASGTKSTIDALPSHEVEGSDVPLDACYVLQPVGSAYAAVVRRDALTGTQAALSVVAFSKLGALLGGTESGVVLDRAARLARTTAFYVASVPRDLHQLDDVGNEFMRWHRGAASAGGGP